MSRPSGLTSRTTTWAGGRLAQPRSQSGRHVPGGTSQPLRPRLVLLRRGGDAQALHQPVHHIEKPADTEVFSPAIRTQLKGAVDAAGQGWSGSSGTSVSAPRRRLLTGGTRPSLAQGLDLQRCFPDAYSEGESW